MVLHDSSLYKKKPSFYQKVKLFKFFSLLLLSPYILPTTNFLFERKKKREREKE